MALSLVSRDAYDQIVRMIPPHDKKIREDRQAGSVYYLRQYVMDEQGRIVCHCDDSGQHWADVSFLKITNP